MKIGFFIATTEFVGVHQHRGSWLGDLRDGIIDHLEVHQGIILIEVDPELRNSNNNKTKRWVCGHPVTRSLLKGRSPTVASCMWEITVEVGWAFIFRRKVDETEYTKHGKSQRELKGAFHRFSISIVTKLINVKDKSVKKWNSILLGIKYISVWGVSTLLWVVVSSLASRLDSTEGDKSRGREAQVHRRSWPTGGS